MAAQSPRRTGLIVTAGLAAAALLLAERRRPLRPRTQAEPRRTLRNATLGALSMAVIAKLQTPLAEPLARRVADRRLGLAQALPTPTLRAVAAFVLLDYTIYVWHVLTHRAPILWRLHLVHHLDLDMDASTALRFHAVDMAVSIPWRLAQIRLVGAGPATLAVWQGFFLASVFFHHSNLALGRWDRRLAWLLTTPAMHDVHHRASRDATDSNWSSGLSLWDRLHGTLRWERPAVGMGVAAYRGPAATGLRAALALPFVKQREAWPCPTLPVMGGSARRDT